MSVMVNIMLFIICFNAAVVTLNVAEIYTNDNNVLFNYSLPNANENEIDDSLMAMNNTADSSSQFFGQNIFSSALQELRGAANTITGVSNSLRLFMVGVIAPGEILQNLCEEIASDPDRTGICADGKVTTANPAGNDGIGTIIKWLNRLIYLMWFLFIIQFVANRSMRNM